MNRKKKIIIVSVVLLLILILIVGIVIIRGKYQDKSLESSLPKPVEAIDINRTDNVKIKDNIKYNTAKNIEKDHYAKNYDNSNTMVVSNIEIYADGNEQKAYFKASITNNDQDYESLTVFVDFYNKDSENPFMNCFTVFDSFKKGETKTIEFDDVEDFSNAYDIKVYY